MKNLLYKEFKLSIHPLYLILPIVLGALTMIPQWIYFLVPLYFCFISVPNILSQYKANNDLTFSAILPVSKKSIVQARILAFIILEFLHILWTLVFTLLHHIVFSAENFSFDLNPAYFGLIILMMGLFNLILFPLYYKTAYKYGTAVITATIAAILFAVIAEVLVIFSPRVHYFMEVKSETQWLTLAVGAILFIAANILSSRISVKRYEKIDI